MAQGVGEPKYDVGLTVYVPYDEWSHYQGKVVDREIGKYIKTVSDEAKASTWHYHVHYLSFPPSFDEWVAEDFIVVDNIESLTIPNKSKPKATAAHTGKADFSNPETFITIPEPLKQQLVKDHDAVRKNRNIRMPRSPCVLDILDSFKEHASEQQPPAPDIDEQVASGICNFFDRALALLLLYEEERPQADALLKNGDSPSSIYGAEHLLRLFLKLPNLLPLESSTHEQNKLLQMKLHDLLDFLSEHKRDYFLPTSSYVKLGAAKTDKSAATATPQPSAVPHVSAFTAAPSTGDVAVDDATTATAPTPGAAAPGVNAALAPKSAPKVEAAAATKAKAAASKAKAADAPPPLPAATPVKKAQGRRRKKVTVRAAIAQY